MWTGFLSENIHLFPNFKHLCKLRLQLVEHSLRKSRDIQKRLFGEVSGMESTSEETTQEDVSAPAVVTENIREQLVSSTSSINLNLL